MPIDIQTVASTLRFQARVVEESSRDLREARNKAGTPEGLSAKRRAIDKLVMAGGQLRLIDSLERGPGEEILEQVPLPGHAQPFGQTLRQNRDEVFELARELANPVSTDVLELATNRSQEISLRIRRLADSLATRVSSPSPIPPVPRTGPIAR